VGTLTIVVGTHGASTTRTAAVARRARRLDARQFVEFCADLWAARGYETRTDGERIVATRPDERVVVLPRAARGPISRTIELFGGPLSRSSAGSTPARRSDVDVVVTPVDAALTRRLADRHDARHVGPVALADLLLYGVDRRDAEALAVRHLGASLPTLLANDHDGADDASDATADRPGLDLTALGAVAGVALLVAAWVVAGVWTPGAFGSADDAGSPLAPGSGTSVRVADGERESSAPTASASTPDDSTVSTPEYPPGVIDGYLDVWSLSRAHAAAVEGRSYQLVIRHSGSEALDADHRWSSAWQRAVVGSGETWLYSTIGYTAANASRHVQYTEYADGEFVYRRTGTAAGPEFDRQRPRIDAADGPHTDRARRYLLRYLRTTEVNVDRPSWDPDRTRLIATGRPIGVDGDVSNYTATAFVSPAGFVSTLTVEYTLDTGGEARTVRFRMQYVAVDRAQVRPPGWYDEARNATATGAGATNVTAGTGNVTAGTRNVTAGTGNVTTGTTNVTTATTATSSP
jgi:hypothetical protein